MLEQIVRRTLNKSVILALVTAFGCTVQVPPKCTFQLDKNTPACSSQMFNDSLSKDADYSAQDISGYDASTTSTKDSSAEITNPDMNETDILSKEINQTGKSCTDLKNYPSFFVTNGKFEGYFVIGEKATAADNLTATDIASSMQYIYSTGKLVPVQINNSSKLDSEITDVTTQNIISIGNPCVNSVSSKLLGNPIPCNEGFSPGKATVKLFQNGDYCAMLVAGYSSADTRLAGKVIAHRWKELSGLEVEIEGTTYSDATITTPSTSTPTPAKVPEYTKVSLAIPSVTVEIKGPNPVWGKITQIDYTIKNNEEGTIKPDYLLIAQIEGYDNDYNKKILLPTSTQTISSGKSISSSIIIPNGFTYSESTTGKVNDVTIGFVLFDSKDTPMASYAKGYDLSGK